MSWGASVAGIGSTVRLLEALRFDFDDGAIYVVGPTVHYAVYHELGTSKMDARPFARPAAERVQANLDSAAGQFLDGDVVEASEDALVRSVALAVEAEMKRIVEAKGIWDTGALHGSISAERVN